MQGAPTILAWCSAIAARMGADRGISRSAELLFRGGAMGRTRAQADVMADMINISQYDGCQIGRSGCGVVLTKQARPTATKKSPIELVVAAYMVDVPPDLPPASCPPCPLVP
jgi:hypothetical protein